MTTEEKLHALIRLRGTQDQTMRCGIVSVLYGFRYDKHLKMTPTERFLEAEIERLQDVLLRRRADLLDQE